MADAPLHRVLIAEVTARNAVTDLLLAARGDDPMAGKRDFPNTFLILMNDGYVEAQQHALEHRYLPASSCGLIHRRPTRAGIA